MVARADVTVTQLRQALSERLVQRLVPSTFMYFSMLYHLRKISKSIMSGYRNRRDNGRRYLMIMSRPEPSSKSKLTRLWSDVLEIDAGGRY